jgi:hypothetical protein
MPLYHRKLVDSNKIICRDNEHLMHLLNKIQAIEVSRTETFISLDQQIDRQIQLWEKWRADEKKMKVSY